MGLTVAHSGGNGISADRKARALRRAALIGGASALALTICAPAFAQDFGSGGDGGQSRRGSVDGIQNGGEGGAGPNGEDGGDGTEVGPAGSTEGGGGGGGAAGVTGGDGGAGGQGADVFSGAQTAGSAGGAGGATPGAAGLRGTDSSGYAGAGGGGGGAHGGVTSANTQTISGGAFVGGNGGNGGDGSPSFGNGGAGGGGQGGYGLLSTQINGTLTNDGSTVTGGDGGDGGIPDFGAGGDGGDGGIGIAFTGAGNSFTNSGTVTGGDGGFATQNTFIGRRGTSGFGGVGITGADLTVINEGSISGGGSGGTGSAGSIIRANAVTFGAGTNIFEYRAGSSVTGNVVGDGDDLFRLGGDTDGNFNVGQLGSTYQGFGTFEKTGASVFTLTGTTAQVTPWTIGAGTLAISSDAALGDSSGALTFTEAYTALTDVSTLRTDADLTSSRNLVLSRNGVIRTSAGTTATFSGVYTGAGILFKRGAGTLVLSGDGSARSGGVYVREGTLRIASANALGSINVSADRGTTVDLIDGLTLSNGFSLINTGPIPDAFVAINQTGGSAIIAGEISGPSANLRKTGSGNLTLSGANTYTGTTTVSEGTLTIANNGALGTAEGGTIVQDGATLAFNAPVLNIADAISITGTGASGAGAFRLQNGDTSLNGLVTLTGDSRVVVNEGGINFRGGVTGDYDLTLNGLGNLQRVVAFSSDLDIGDNDVIADNITVAFYAGNSFTGDVRINSSTLELAAGGASTIDDNARLTMTASGRFVRLTLYQDETIGSLAGSSGFISAGNGDRVLTLGGDNTSTSFGGEFITGGGTLSVVKTGTGTMTLSRASNFQNNPFLGGLTIAGGTLAISADRVLGADSAALTFDGTGATLRTLADLSSARNIALDTGGIFNTDPGTTATFAGIVSGAGSLTKIGAGTLALTGQNTYTGGTSLDAGTIRVGSNNALGTNGLTSADGTTLDFASGVTIGNNIVTDGVLTLNQSGGSSAHSGAITGAGGITKTGAGSLRLSGNQLYDGITRIAGGVLIADSDFSLGTTMGNTIVENGATLDLQGVSTPEAITISGNGVNGAGALRNSALFSTLNGRVTLAADATITSGGSTLQLAGGIDGNHDLTLNSGSQIQVNSDLAIGDGNLILGGTGIVALTRTNSFTGDVTVNGGRLVSGADNGNLYDTIGNGAAVTLGAGTSWRLAQSNETIGSLAGSGDVYIDGFLTSGRLARLTVGGANTSTTFGGRLREQNNSMLSLTKTGTGTLTLTGNNTYSGGTILSGGTLGIEASSALGSGTVRAANGAGLTFADGINLANAIELTGDASGTVSFGVGSGEATVAGIISGTAGVLKVDPGTLVLTGENTYTGGTTIAGGTISIAADAALGNESGAIRFTGGTGTLRTTRDFFIYRDVFLDGSGRISTDANTNASMFGYIRGTGDLTKVGAGTLTLLDGNTYSGDTFLTEGKLELYGNDALGSGRLFASDDTTITYGGINTIANAVAIAGTVSVNADFGTGTQSGVISGAGGLRKIGAGNVRLSGANTYSGNTTLAQGGLALGNNSALGTGTLTAADGTRLSFGNNLRITNAMTLNGQVSFDQEGGTAELRNITSGTGGLTKTGSGELTISGANDYTGETLVSAGSLKLVSTGTLGTTDGGVRVLDGASLTLDGVTLTEGVTISGAGLSGTGALRATRGSATVSGPITLADASTIGSEVTSFRIAGGITGDHDLKIIGGRNTIIEGALNIGTGMLTKDSTGNLTLGGDSTFSGGTLLNAGRLFVLSDRALGTGSLTAADGTRLTFNNPANLANDVTLNGDLGVGVYLSGGTLSGIISGSGSLTNESSGTLTLSGDNTYEGGTFLTSGGLRLANDGALGTGALTASDSTLIEYANGVTIGNAIALNGVVELSPTTGTSEQTGLISGDGTLNKVGTGLLLLDGANTYTGGTRISGGVLAIGSDASLGAASSALTFSGFNNATLQLRGYWNTSRAININAVSAKIDNFGYDADIAGTITGGGVLALFGSGTVTLSGANTHSGGTYLYGGRLVLTNSSAVGTGDMFANNATTISLASAVGLDNDLEFTGDIAFDQSAGDASFAGGITQFDTGSLTKTGAGNLVLSGASTYYGNTVVAEGTLTATSASALGSTEGGTIVRDGASLALNGTFDLAESLHLSGTGVLGLGALQQRGGQVGIDGSITLDAASTIASYSGTLTLNGGVSGAHDLAIGGNVNIASDVQIGAGTLTMHGGATLTLTGTNTYTGGTVLNAGTVVIGNDSAFGTGTITARNATIGFGATDLALSNAINLQGGLTLDIGDTNAGVDGGISGAGMFLIMGSGNMQLSGANSYSGNTGLVDATLTLANDAALGTSTLLASAGSTVDYADGVTIGNRVGLTGGVILNQGLGSATQSGLIEGDNSGLTKTGSGILALTEANTYTGATDIQAGTLLVNGDQSAATGLTSVFDGATLGGKGIVGGDVTLADGASLNPGTSPGTLTINGDLALSGGSILNFEFGEAGVVGGALNDLVNVGGDLTLDGTLNVRTSAGGTFGAGVYRVFNYGGTLTDNGLDLGTAPNDSVFVQTSVANQVNLINTAGANLGFWDGAGGEDNDAVDGGSGSWMSGAGNRNWTNADGTYNGTYADGTFAVFQGTAGTVSVYTGLGPVRASGLQFVTDGYIIDGDTLTLNGGAQSTVRVGDGTAAAENTTATISAEIAGDTQLVKTDFGTLILSGDNSYTGGTRIDAGTIRVADDAALGAESGELTFAGSGSTLQTSANFTTSRNVLLIIDGTIDTDAGTTATFGGVISGARNLGKTGAGTLTLSGNNTFTGSTYLNGGTLALASNNALGAGSLNAIGGTKISYGSGIDIANGVITTDTVTFDQSGGTATQSGVISGLGNFTKSGNGNLVLSAANAYNGNNALVAGTLTIANDRALSYGTLMASDGTTVAFADGIRMANGVWMDGALDIHQSGGSATIAGQLMGNGPLTKTGSGSLTIGRGSAFTGDTFLNEGTLVLGSGQSLGNGTLTAADGTSLRYGASYLRVSNAIVLNGNLSVSSAGRADQFGVISGTGSLTTNAALTLNGANTYSGGTDIQTYGITVLNDSALGTGNVSIRDFGSLTYGDGIALANALTLNGISLLGVDEGESATQNGVVSGSGTLSLFGTGTLTLNGANTYSGGTEMTEGTILVGNNSALGTGTLSAVGGTLGFAAANLTLTNDIALPFEYTVDTAANGGTLSGAISGAGTLNKTGFGNLTLSGDSSYDGETIVRSGTLTVASNKALGSTIGGTTIEDGATLVLDNARIAENISISGSALGTGALTGSGTITGTVTLNGDATITAASGGDLDLDGAIAGMDRNVTFGGSGGFGDVNVNGGIATGSGGVTVDYLNVEFNSGNSFTGDVTMNGGSLWLTASGASTIADTARVVGNGGRLYVGQNETIGSLSGSGLTVAGVFGSNTLSVGGDDTSTTFGGTLGEAFGGTLGLTKTGTGTLTLTGANTYSGGTNVAGGTLLVNGDQSTATGLTSVFDGATLGGNGTIGGDVTLADGASLNPGTSPGTLTINGNLALSSGSILNFEFGEAGVAGGSLNDLVNVGGDLTLDGTLNVSRTAGGTFGAGIYRMFNYDGALTDNGLVLGSAPTANLYIQTSVANQVNLINTVGMTFGFWDGAAGASNGTIDGGDGVWQNSTGNLNWTGANGAFNGAYDDGTYAIFQGAAGTVTIDTSLGDVTASGAQFVTDGYVIDGDMLTLTGGAESIIRVGDGTATGANVTTTIIADIAGATRLVKTDLGTLVLSGDNSYSGGTSLEDGALVLGSDTALGTGTLSAEDGTAIGFVADLTIANAIALDGTVAFDTDANSVTQNGVLSGSGTLAKVGSGTLNLTAANTYAGTIDVQAGMLANSGTVAAVINRAAFTNSGIAGDVGNTGMLDNSGTLASLINEGSAILGATSNVTGSVSNRAGATLSSSGTLGGAVVNAGTFGAQGAANGTISNEGAGRFTVTGDLASNGSDIGNSGNAVLAVTGGDLTGVGTLVNTSSGADGAGGNAGLTIADSRTLAADLIGNSGEIMVAGTLAARVEQTAGLLTNNGTIAGDLVANGGAVAGIGGFEGDVTILADATFAPGTIGGAATVGIDGTFGLGGTATYDLGTADVIGGATNDLILAGSAVIDGGTFDLNNAGAGSYRLVNTGSAGSIAVGAVTLANAAAGSRIYTTGNGQYLNVQVGYLSTQYWDGSASVGDGVADGGAGVWTNALGTTNWTAATGALNNSWQGTANPPVTAVFGGTAGTVSVDDGAGYVGFGAMRFDEDGYVIADAGDGATPVLGANGSATNAFAGIASSDGGIASTITVADANSIARVEAGIAGVSPTTGLIVDGAGTLELAGNNEGLTGTIAVLGGTLRASGGAAVSNASALVLRGDARFEIADDEAVGSLDGGAATAVSLGENSLITGLNGDDTTFGGTISGTGDFVKTGTGSLTLTGANTYTGITAVTDGALILGADNALSDDTVVAVQNATFDLQGHSDTVGMVQLVDGVLAGSGTLSATGYRLADAQVDANLGTGTLFQTGGTSVLGGTSAADIVAIGAGTLRLGANERLADSASVQVDENATFDLAGTSETIAALYGMGTLDLGAGRLTLGGTGLDSGFGGLLTGTGTLTKTGSGMFTLLGDQLGWTGNLEVQGGTLRFVGNSGGGALISGGMLSGNASFASGLTMTGGTVSPGIADAPIGVIAAQTIDLTGGTALFDFRSPEFGGGADMLLASGAITISGTQVAISSEDPRTSFPAVQRYAIVQGDSLTGTFANGDSFQQMAQAPQLFWRLRYDLVENGVALEVRRMFDFGAALGDGGTPNQIAVATTLSSGQLDIGDAFADAILPLSDLDQADQLRAFDSLGGESLTGATTAAFIEGQRFADLLTQRIYSKALMKADSAAPTQARALAPVQAGEASALTAPSIATVSMWMQSFGGATQLDGDAVTRDLRTDASGFAGGIEARYGVFKAGVAGGYTDGSYDVRSLGANMQGETVHVGGYLGYEGEAAFAGLFGAYQKSDLDSTRAVTAANTSPLTAQAHIDMTGRTFGGFAGYRAPVGAGLVLAPMVGVTNIRIKRDGFDETGANPLNLQVSKETREVTYGTAQLRLSTVMPVAGGTFEPYLAGGVERYWGDRRAVSDMCFAGAAGDMGSFRIIGAPLEETVGVVGAGFDVRPNDRFEIGASAGARVGNRVTQGTVEMHARIRF
ncbi:autotransporter-associated beta strand repeat-containing protein [Citromicrobium bathyomarinum]|uniref:autotransporter-associated beta strand repeat-containing protein n=1 Tax=Citromicrobium bathyomarinum TaxID=72174 RepID=UPI003159DF24